MKKVKSDPMTAILALVLLVQILLIIGSNVGMIEYNLDGDSAKLMNHVRKMWEAKTPVIPGWSYSTTLEWDCTALFALPLYGLTKNIYLSCAVSNTIFLALFLAVLFFVFYGQKPIYPILCANLICLPYRVGMLDYYNMLFFSGTQYIVKVMIPLLLIGLLLFAEREKEERQDVRIFWFFAVLYLGFLLVSCMSSGIYVAVCGLIPVLAVYLGSHFFRWERVSMKGVILGVGSILCVPAGLIVNSAVMSGTRAASMVLCDVYHMLINTSSCFFGLFELMGGLTETENIQIFSLQGISILSKFVLVAVLLVCGGIALAKCLKKQGNLRTVFLLAVPLWNFFILNASYVKAGSASYEYRYHLMGMLPLICVAATVLLDALSALPGRQRNWLSAAGVAALVFFNGICFGALFTRGEQHRDLRELNEYIEMQDVAYVYMYDEVLDPDICRLFGDKVLYLALALDGGVWAYDYYTEYSPGELQTDNAIVVVANAAYDLGESFSIAGHSLVKYDEFADRSLYYFAE